MLFPLSFSQLASSYITLGEEKNQVNIKRQAGTLIMQNVNLHLSN